MNILILNWRDTKNPRAGGAEIVTLEYAKAWVKMGHKVTWFTSGFEGSKESEVFEGIFFIRKGNPFSVILHAPFFYFFSGEKFDVIIDEIHGLPFFTVLYVRKSKIIAFIHEIAGEIWDYMYPFPLSKIGKFLESTYLTLYRNIPFWTVSDSTKDDLIKGGIKEKNIHVFLNGFHSPSKKKEVKEITPTFLFVSRLVKMKGIENVLEAFRIISKNMRSQLWIVGEGEKSYTHYLKSKAKELGEMVTFWGKVPDNKKFELMGRSHLLLHASVKEGWGLVVIEAASQGTPSIVYNVSGLRDSVMNNKTGVVLKKNTPEEMANEAMALYLNTKRYKQFQKNCLVHVKSLTWEKVTKRSETFLRSL